MDTWPNEIALHVLQLCDIQTLLNVRQTCSINQIRVEEILRKIKSFDFSHYYVKKSICNSKFSLKKMTSFFHYFQSLKELTLSNLPSFLTLTDMIQLSKVVPHLTSLSIIQTEDEFIGKDVFLTLIYFESLQKLKIVGWEPKQIVRRGCAARFEVIPVKSLKRLKSLHIVCNKNTVSRILFNIVSSEIVLEEIENVVFEVRHSSQDIPVLTMQFIASHPHLKFISFNGFLFTTQSQVEMFYSHLLTLQHLERLDLFNCSAIDRIEGDLQENFLNSLKLRGIKFNNVVNSLRHL